MKKSVKNDGKRNKLVVYLMVFVLMAVAVAGIITADMANDDRDGNVSGAGFNPVEPKPLGSEIEINSIEDLMKIGVDPGYPLSGDYLQTADLDFTDLSSNVISQLGWMIKLEVNSISSTAPYDVTFTVYYSMDGINYNLAAGATVQYFFGQYNTGSSTVILPATGEIEILGSQSKYTGDSAIGFAIGGNIDDPVLNKTFAASIYVENPTSLPAPKESFQMGNFKPIGTYTNPFTGKYDGNGYSIIGMELAHYYGNASLTGTDRYRESLGMFANASDATFVNMEFIGGSLTNVMVSPRASTDARTATSYSGAVVGFLRDFAFEVDNCYSSMDLTASSSTGGIIGRTVDLSESSTTAAVTNCTNTGRITVQESLAGGIVGVGQNIIDSINTGNIYGISYSGGITGYQYPGTIEGCANYGRIIMMAEAVGGIAGSQLGQIIDSFNFGDVSGTSAIGGISGNYYNTQTIPQLIKRSSNHGNITGTFDVGGIIGNANISSAGVESCLNTGDVSGTTRVAGIMGTGNRVVGSFNTGEISGSDPSGVAAGIIGSITSGSNPSVLESGNTGKVDGKGYISGIVGYINTTANAKITIKDCYNQGVLTTTMASHTLGGIVGYIAMLGLSGEFFISHTYNSVIMSSSAAVRGIIGTIVPSVQPLTTIEESYYLYDPLLTNTGAPGVFDADTTPMSLADFSDPSKYTPLEWTSGAPWKMDSSINDGMPYFGFMTDITVGTGPREQIRFDGQPYSTIDSFVTGEGLPFVTYLWKTSSDGINWDPIPSGVGIVDTLPALNTTLMGDGASPTAFFKCEVTPILKGVSGTPIDSGEVTFKAFFGMTIDTDMTMSSGTTIWFNLGGSAPTWVSPTLGERIMLKNPDDLTSADLSLKFTGAAGQDIIKWKEAAGGTESPNDTWAFGGTYNKNLRFVAVLGYQVTLTDYDYTAVGYEYTTGQTSSSGTYGSSTVLLVGLDDTLELTATPVADFYFRGWDNVSADNGVKTLTSTEVTALTSIKAQSAPLMTIPTAQADQELLDGASAGLLYATMPATSSFYSFQWKQSVDDSTWSDVSSAGTSDSYDPGTWQVSDGAMYFKCVITSLMTGEEISTSSVNIIAYYGLMGMTSDRTIAGTTLQYSVGGGWQDFTSTVLVRTTISVKIDGLTAGQNGVMGWEDSTGIEYKGNNSEWNNLTLTENMTVEVFLGFYVTFINDGDGKVTSDEGDLPVLLGWYDSLILTASDPGPGYKFTTWSGSYGTGPTATVRGDAISAPLTVTGTFTQVLMIGGDLDVTVKSVHVDETQTLIFTVNNPSGLIVSYQWYERVKDVGVWQPIGDGTDTLVILTQDAGAIMEYMCVVSADDVGPLESSIATIAMYYQLTISSDVAEGQIEYMFAGGTWTSYSGPILLMNSPGGTAVTHLFVRFSGLPTGMGVALWSTGLYASDSQEFDVAYASSDVDVFAKLGFAVVITVGENGDVEYSRDNGVSYKTYVSDQAIYVGTDEVLFKATPNNGFKFNQWEGISNTTDSIALSNLTEPVSFSVSFRDILELNGPLFMTVLIMILVTAVICGVVYRKDEKS